MRDDQRGHSYAARARRRHELRRADDEDLLRWARNGDTRAFAELYDRHRAAAHAYAQHLSRRHRLDDGADDLVAEAIRKLLGAIDHGKGPLTGFRPYLFAGIRSVAFTRARSLAASLPAPDLAVADGIEGQVDAIVAAAALDALPERWQTVLWATQVLGYSPAEIAPVLGLTPNHVAVLTRRARAALRTAYVRSYLPRTQRPECARALDALARNVAAGSTTHGTAAVRDHVADCRECLAATAQLTEELGTRHEDAHAQR
jgi:RNA polymerase sigma factor (sigma-70 family)